MEPDHWAGFKLEHEDNVGLGFPKVDFSGSVVSFPKVEGMISQGALFHFQKLRT